MPEDNSSSMKRILLVLFIVLIGTRAFAACPGGVCYVRPDGGTCGGSTPQCLGGIDAAYDGSGTGEACSCKNPYYVIGWYQYGNQQTGGQAGIMSGGDTVIISPGTYIMGNNPSGDTFSCGSVGYTCTTRRIPSGTALVPTRVAGCTATGCPGHCKEDGGCPKLTGMSRIEWFFDVRFQDYVQLDSLEITDNSTCGEQTNTCSVSCINSCLGEETGGKIGGVYLGSGISAGASNITLENLYIHDLFGHGLKGNVNTMNVIDTNLEFNSTGGWNADVCTEKTTQCPVSGTITFSGSTPVTTTNSKCSVKWNGCQEAPGSDSIPANGLCADQSAGGYGDGLGTNYSNADFIFNQCDVSWNTQDGVDLLYLNRGGMTGGSVTIKRSRVEGNVGNAIKCPNDMLLEDNLILGNCMFFEGKDYQMSPGTFTNCRSGGAPIAISFSTNTEIPKIYSNTILSNGDTGIQTSSIITCTSGNPVYLYNNIMIGGYDYGSTDKSDMFYNSSSNCTASLVEDYNACDNNWKYSECASANDINGTLASIKFTGTISQGTGAYTGYYTGEDYMDQVPIASDSPAVNAADESLSGDDAYDFNYYNRGASWDIGGLEYNSSTPSAVCGDGVIEGTETCDDDDTDSLDGCSNVCAIEAGYSCTGEPSVCTADCGNTVCAGSEECDTADMCGQTCESQGFSTGTLSCDASCNIVTTGCVAYSCGNSVLDPGEPCDYGLTPLTCSINCENINPNYENFLNYNETDPNGRLDVNTHNIVAYGLTHNESANVKKDFGAGYFGDFKHRFKVQIDSCNDNGSWEDGGVGIWSMATASYADMKLQQDALDGMVFSLQCWSSSARYLWQLSAEQ